MEPFIRIHELSKSFGDHRVIDQLSLDIEREEVVIFQGPSGIGKSTFLRCLTLLEPFQQGTIQVGDLRLQAGMDEIRHRSIIRPLRRRLGFVFQFFNLFPHLTVVDNLTLGPIKVLGASPDVARAAALQLLDRVGLRAKADALPRMLSGGQQQRVGIARALAMHPEGILFDEPTSSLDPYMKEEIVKVMQDLKGLTMLVVTHEPAFVERIATRLITFGPGCKIESDKRL